MVRSKKCIWALLLVIAMVLWALSAFFFSLAFLYGYIRFYVFLGSFSNHDCIVCV